ncbi:MAG: hypothetical protein GF353_28715 [Candidatus Lokiarchaeota archaeon]|nr:hypothetical protein [Candidatus Lokiarchaeota archaeon]MBD3353985.1 hypothetical protein [Candidatus Lokiarchaeota archaeon]
MSKTSGTKEWADSNINWAKYLKIWDMYHNVNPSEKALQELSDWYKIHNSYRMRDIMIFDYEYISHKLKCSKSTISKAIRFSRKFLVKMCHQAGYHNIQ